ncbi:MAG: hypothetical protein MUE73_10750 [Planctomycetes bacterium]|nr:hypothetical protein [Planctomycetota bacterium]
MLLSAEIRWFWRREGAGDVLSWFADERIHGCPPGGGPPAREDVYLVDRGQTELGVKTRGAKEGASSRAGAGRLEVKGLVALDPDVLASGPFAGPVEIWCKWPFGGLSPGTAVRCPVRKTRWLRKFDTAGATPVEIPLGADEKPREEARRDRLPATGCNVEVTDLEAEGGDLWLSFGLEAFGVMDTLRNSLRGVTSALAGRGGLPSLDGGFLLSYPSWIERFAFPS